MKFILLLAVVGTLLWWMFGRQRRVDGDRAPPPKPPAGPVQMLACAHCGVNLPASEALMDDQQRIYCGEAHRLAGPR